MIHKTLTFLLFIALSINGFCQRTNNFRSLPEKPYNGKALTVFYNPSGTPLQNKESVNAVVYKYTDYKWEAADIKFVKAGKEWKSDLQVPINTGILAFKFVSGDSIDNNKDFGYFIMLNDKDRPGKMAPGGYIGWGFARSPSYGKNIPGYINFKGISDTATYHWLNQEILNNQKSKSLLARDYAIALSAYMGEHAAPKLVLATKYLTRTDANESELLDARYISANLIRDKNLTDSINMVISQKFPNGSIARLAAFKKMSSIRDIDSLLVASEDFLSKFPEANTNAKFNLENRINYGVIYQNLMVFGRLKKRPTDYVSKYIDSLPYNMLTSVYYKLIGIPYHRKEGDLKKIAEDSDLFVKRFEYFKANQPASMAYLSPSEWKSEYQKTFVAMVSSDHIGLLNYQKRYQQALQYAKEAQAILDCNNAEINNQQALSLKMLGLNKDLQVLLKKSMFKNQSSTEMIAMIREAFVKERGSEKGFQEYLESLKNPADKEKELKDIKESMIKKEMPTWSMKDLNGKTVNSNDLKGKTVILDFWATWCVPCKASFPGMKLAVEKYKNDPDVVFYFVDTEERGDTYKTENAKYIKDNNYPFNVLFDNRLEGMKTNSEVFNKICKAFTISGIPQKLIIDKNGYLRFISIGFKGSATGLADEMTALIEMTKKAE